MENTYINIHERLIAGCLHNDATSQKLIYNLYYKSMYNTALRIVKNSHEAEDIMQEAFLTAFQKIASYQHKASFGAWLKRIVINKSLDYIKNYPFHFDDLSSPIHYTLPESDNSLNYQFFSEESDYDDATILEVIKSSIDNLPGLQRVVFTLVHLENMDYDEICIKLKISKNNCRSIYSRAKSKVIKEVKKKIIFGIKKSA